MNGVSFAALGSAGKVLGSFVDSGGSNAYFVFDPNTDTYATVVDPAAAAGCATSANEVAGAGQVVGTYTDSAGAVHSFIALPSSSNEAVINTTVAVADSSGALLSDGTSTGTSITVTPEHLSELRLLPPAEFEGSVALRVSEVVETASGPAVTAPQTMLVNVNPVAAPPILTLGSPSVTVDENAAIDLSGVITVSSSDGEPTTPSRSHTVTIAGIPADATLDKGTVISAQPDGTTVWQVDPTDLGSLHLLVGESEGYFGLVVTATAHELEDGSTASSTAFLQLHVQGVADAPNVTLTPGNAAETFDGTLLANTIAVSPTEPLIYSYSISGTAGSTVAGINDAQQIVGTFSDAGGLQHGFVFDNGTGSYTPSTLPAPPTAPPRSASTARAWWSGIIRSVPDQQFSTNTPAAHAFIYDPATGSYTDITAPDAVDLGSGSSAPSGTFATGISNSGQVVGNFTISNSFSNSLSEGFLYDPTQASLFTDIAPTGASTTTVTAINDTGEIVGDYEDPGNAWHRIPVRHRYSILHNDR